MRRPEPSGTFAVRESQRTTYNDLLSSPAPPQATHPWENIPAGPRVPHFGPDELDDHDLVDPPTRRDLPLPPHPAPPGKPHKK